MVPKAAHSHSLVRGRKLTLSHGALPSSALHASPFLEPEEAEDPADAHLLLEDLSDGHARVDELLASLITDAGHERGRFADQAQLLSRDGGRGKQGCGDHRDFPTTAPLSVPRTSVPGRSQILAAKQRLSKSSQEGNAKALLLDHVGRRK